jgi:hypothetical protein
MRDHVRLTQSLFSIPQVGPCRIHRVESEHRGPWALIRHKSRQSARLGSYENNLSHAIRAYVPSSFRPALSDVPHVLDRDRFSKSPSGPPTQLNKKSGQVSLVDVTVEIVDVNRI